MIRKAKAVWRGTGRDDTGNLSTDSGVLAETPYSFRTRFDGLVRSLRRNHLGIDVFELRVAVGMLRALVRRAVRLPAVAERQQQSAHAVGADPVTHPLQGDSQLVMA